MDTTFLLNPLRMLSLTLLVFAISSTLAAKPTPQSNKKSNKTAESASKSPNKAGTVNKERVLQMEFDIALGNSQKAKPMVITQNGTPTAMSQIDEDGNGFELIVTPRLVRPKTKAKSNAKKYKQPLLAMEIGIKEVKKNNFGPQENFTMITELGKLGEMSKKNKKGKEFKVAVKGTLLPRPARQ